MNIEGKIKKNGVKEKNWNKIFRKDTRIVNTKGRKNNGQKK